MLGQLFQGIIAGLGNHFEIPGLLPTMEEVDLPIQGRHGDIASLADARERHLVQQERQDLTVFVGAPLAWRGFVSERENLPANLTAHSSTAAFGLPIPDVGPLS